MAVTRPAGTDDPIALARRHVRQCTDLVRRQEAPVENLRRSGRDTNQAEDLPAGCRRHPAERPAYLDSLLQGG